MHNLIAHALITNTKGEILITKRTAVERGKKNFEGGKWDIPGGKVEALELPSEAVIREAREEVNLEVVIKEILFEKSNVDVTKKQVFTTLIYLCECENCDEIKLDEKEHDEYQWLSIDDILVMDDNQLVSYMKEAIMCLRKFNK